MLNLISRIGKASAAGSTPGRATGKGSGYITATVDRASLAKLTRQLESVDKKVRDKVAKTTGERALEKAAKADQAHKHPNAASLLPTAHPSGDQSASHAQKSGT